MAVRDFPISAAAFQVLAAVDAYEVDMAALARDWLNLGKYSACTARLDDLKVRCASLPEVSVEWVAVLVSRTDLFHTVWKLSRQSLAREPCPLSERASGKLQQHTAAIDALRRKCARMIARAEA